jgi:hypothetical protein
MAAIRTILYEPDGDIGNQVLDIRECDVDNVPAPGAPAADVKAQGVARRRLLRELDRQITDLLSGSITEIRLFTV